MCLITKCLVFLQVIRVFVYIFVDEGSMTNAKVYQGSTMTKKLKSTALEPRLMPSHAQSSFNSRYPLHVQIEMKNPNLQRTLL